MLSPEEFQAIFEAAPDGVAVVGSDGVIRAVNPKMEQLFGWPSEELVGQAVEVLLPHGLRDAHRGHRTGFVQRPHDRPMGVGLDLKGLRKDGTEFPVEISLSPWRQQEGELRIICTVRDVSAYRRLRNFSEGALRATEEERKRIARELHDDTAQRLATLILRVGMLAREGDDEARAELFEQVRQEIVDAADGVKRMSRGLRPPELEELGLALALHAHIRSLGESGFRVAARLGSVDDVLDQAQKLAIYRIIQEALSNVRRHAGVSSASVRLFRSGDDVVGEVADRGRGFDPSETDAGASGLGLLGMQERATMIGGRVDVDSEVGRGTRIRIIVPVSTDAEQ